MSDEQNHNDPLERLFRKKSEEYNISYREEDWLNLEKQLDAHDMKLYYRRRLRWLAAASILILSLIGYYTIQNHNKINQLTEQLNQTEQIQQNDQTTDSNSREDLVLAENESDEQSDPIEDIEETSNGVTTNENQSTEQNQAADIFSENNSEIITATSEEETEADQTENIPRRTFAEATQTIRERPVEPNELFPNRSSILAFDSFENQPQPVELRGGESNVRYESDGGDSNISPSAMINGPLSVQNGFNSSTDAYPTESNFAIGFVISPDLSTAGGVSNFYNPGFKGGILAEYSISKNFSLISGLTISNLKYKADGQAYNPPQGWNYGQMPSQTRAICVVLDIPLNLKANLFNFDRSRIFATAGLSSYIMLNEDYRFRYDNSDQAGLDSSWSDATGTRHWFSNAGFSIGIEYDLSPNWSLRAEPHIKVPLKGVGWGDVELYSMGSFVSLNYRFGSL